MLHHGAHGLLQAHGYNAAVSGYAWYGMRDGGPASMELHGPVVIDRFALMLLLVEFESEAYHTSRSTVWFFQTKLPSGLNERARVLNTS